jgi:hypothetical protein
MINRVGIDKKETEECDDASFFDMGAFFVFSALYLSLHHSCAVARMSFVQRTLTMPHGIFCRALGSVFAKIIMMDRPAADAVRSFYPEPFFREINAQRECTL